MSLLLSQTKSPMNTTRNFRDRFGLGLIAFSLAGAITPLCLAQLPGDVVTFHNDNSRTGQNAAERVLTPANVNAGNFGKLLTVAMDGKVDAQPLFAKALPIPGRGKIDTVFAATEHDSVYAFDAQTGAILWHRSLLAPGETPSDPVGCGQVVPEIGITATPVIDRKLDALGTMYVVAMSKDSTGRYHQRLHALSLPTGAERSNSPIEIQATYPGTGDESANGLITFDPRQHEERAGLLLSNGTIYTSWSSHCDIRPYSGWVIAYDAFTLKQAAVTNLSPHGSEASIWASGAGPAADAQGNVFISVANGTFDTQLNAGGFPNQGDFGNAYVKLTPRFPALTVTDYWTMFNTISESDQDLDLGSGGIMLMPDVMDAAGKVRHLAVGAGKDSNLYVVDRDNMGKFSPNSNSTIYQELPKALSGEEFGTPAFFNGSVYLGSVGDVLRSYSVIKGLLSTVPTSVTATPFTYPGTTPSVSSNANNDGIVWAVDNTSPASLHAYDARNLAVELYSSNQAPNGRDQFGPGNKFIVPTVANGKVFVGTTNSVAVFGLLR